MGTKRVGWARIKSLINENQNQLKIRNLESMAVSKAITLTGADSGKIIYATTKTSAAYAITLPRVSNGLNFRIVLATTGNDGSADVTIAVGHADDDFNGNLWGLSAVDPATDSDTNIVFGQSGGAVKGDWVDLHSDGTDWWVRGQGTANGAVVFG